MRRDVKNFAFAELKEVLARLNQPSHRAGQIFSWVYKARVEDFKLMTDISNADRAVLDKEFYSTKLRLLKREVSCDATEKFLLALDDGYSIETVLIPQCRRNTVCVSTQVGCPRGCGFCLSGRGGFKRNLSSSEIINQYLAVSDLIAPRKVTNVVFMGIGEPLDNFSNTVAAIKVLLHQEGISLGKRRICVSTCGLADKIKELGILHLGIKLSISLHSPYDDIRSKIMPVNKKYPIAALMKAARQYCAQEDSSVSFEYSLIKGLNTRPQDIAQLKKWLSHMDYKLNIISYNKGCAGYLPPSDAETKRFLDGLKSQGMFYTFRKPRGDDINAACGQLKAEYRGEKNG